MSKRYKTAPDAIVLCEDIQTRTFARRYLKQRKPSWKKVQFDPQQFQYSQGEMEGGIGNSYVLKKFINNVVDFRRNVSKNPHTCLIVIIDADNQTPAEKISHLNRTLQAGGESPIRHDERIAILSPKRNIETWIRYGEGESVNENRKYPHLNKPRKCQSAVDNYVNNVCVGELPADAPSSLHHACGELAKIL